MMSIFHSCILPCRWTDSDAESLRLLVCFFVRLHIGVTGSIQEQEASTVLHALLERKKNDIYTNHTHFDWTNKSRCCLLSVCIVLLCAVVVVVLGSVQPSILTPLSDETCVAQSRCVQTSWRTAVMFGRTTDIGVAKFSRPARWTALILSSELQTMSAEDICFAMSRSVREEFRLSK